MKYRASYHQERIWFIDKFERESLYKNGPVYHNIPSILYTKNSLDINKVNQSIKHLLIKFEALRTKLLTEENVLYQEIIENLEIPLNKLDCKGSLNHEEICEYLIEISKNAFSYGINEELIKCFYLDSKDEAYIMFVFHHSICDDVSKDLFRDEFIRLYKNTDIHNTSSQRSINTDDLQYIDYALWQRDLAEEVIEREVMYWKNKLSERIQALELPTDYKRAAVHIYDPASYQLSFPKEFQEKLKNCHEMHGVTEQIFLLTAFKVLMMKYSGLTEINIGTSIRDGRLDEVRGTFGPISNLVILSDKLEEKDSFLEAAKQIGITYEEARAHSTIPFDRLVMEIKPENDMSRTAFFDHLFQYVQIEKEPSSLFQEIEQNHGWGKYDYNLLIRQTTSDIELIMTYNKLYYEPISIMRLLDNYITICEGFLNDPLQEIGSVGYISNQEKQLLIEKNNEVFEALTEYCIHEAIEEQIKKAPRSEAVKDEKDSLTYEELGNLSNRIANWLVKKGIQEGDVVAILMDKTTLCIATMLGILKTGAAYLPIDATLPKERVDYMLYNSEAKCILAEEFAKGLIKDYPMVTYVEAFKKELANFDTSFQAIKNKELTAYIIYTSGTTGKPKGVMLSHENVTRLILNNKQLFDFDENDVWSMFHSYHFDFSVWEMYGALMNGGKLALVSKEIARDTKLFRSFLINHEVTILNQTPSAFYALSEEEMKNTNKLKVRKIIFGGEALNSAKLKDWKQKYQETTMINMYGITETTIHVTYKELSEKEIEEGINSIGHPLPTYTGYVMNEKLELVPFGVKGEFVVGGSGVAKGYLKQPELTKAKFIENPFKDGERLYRSGDLVRKKYNGEIEYLGRIDKQVQIRGFRVEIGEIESTLMKHDAISEAVVLPRDNGIGSLELIGYVVIKDRITLNHSVLYDYIKALLPEYMIPARFVKIDRIPTTCNGKVDQDTLLKTKGNELSTGTEFVAANTPIQKELMEFWKQVIDAKEIGIHDNFFHLGGNSILVTKLIFLINEKYHMEVPYKYFFTRPTIASLEDYFHNHSIQAQSKEEQLDLEAEMVLPDDIWTNERPKIEGDYKNIFLTGATGFLGAYLLKDLLDHTKANVYCLVRAVSEEEAKKRLLDNLKFYQLYQKKYEKRLIMVLGDLEKKRLGLSKESFLELASQLDVILHNGAIARFGYSYKQLKNANVDGTTEILRLALQNKVKPVHYISTISVFDATAKKSITEEDIPDYENPDNLCGYSSSKIVSEGIIRKAREKGLIINIYRLGRISGATNTGACQMNDYLWMMLKACIEINSMIQQAPSDMIPVDVLSKAIITTVLHDNTGNHNYHFLQKQSITAKEILNWISECGFEVSFDTYDIWHEKLIQKAMEEPQGICASLVPILGSHISNQILFDISDAKSKIYYDTEKILQGVSTEELFKKTIEFFKEQGYFPKTEKCSKETHAIDALPSNAIAEFI